jgi:hypothetical protein
METRRRSALRGVLCAAILLGGCGDGNHTSDTIDMSSASTTSDGSSAILNPLGTVGGLLLDAGSQQPLAGVAVKVIAGGTTLSGMSDMNGTFVIPMVPSGPFIFQASLTGYLTAQFASNLGGAVGESPVQDPQTTIGPIGLIKSTGSFSVLLVDQTGAPAAMVKVVGRTHQANYVDFSSGNGVGVGSMELTAQSGADGMVQFTGLPEIAEVLAYVDPEFTVDVPPQKIASTNSYSFLGLSLSYNLAQLGMGTGNLQAPTIVLAGPTTALAVLGSNIPTLNGVTNTVSVLTVPPNGPLTIVFNQAIDPKTVRAQFYNEDGLTLSPAQPMATVTTNVLTMTPNQALVAAARYDVLLHVDALLSGGSSTEYNTLAPFFVEQASGVTPTVNMGSISRTVNGGTQTVTFTLNEPIGLGQGNTNAIDCVAFYEGVNLDNGDPAFYPGEWSATAGALKCVSQANPPPLFDATILRPIEQAPFTGFASKFSITINNIPGQPTTTNSGACSPLAPPASCAGPQMGKTIHLVFSKLAAGATIRRTNGQPVVDDPVKLIIPIP